MEDRESEKIYEKLNLNPQLLINEFLNCVDELFEVAFDYLHREATTLLNTDGTDVPQDLKSGVNYIRSAIRASLDEQLSHWEKYCLRHCFALPSGFSLPFENTSCVLVKAFSYMMSLFDAKDLKWEPNFKLVMAEASGEDPMDQDDDSDEQVEAQLDSLRSKLAEAKKECSELNKELRELETKSDLTNHCASAVNEALQLYDNSSARGMFQEMLRLSAELRQKMDQLKTKQKNEIEHNQRGRNDVANRGLSDLKLDDLQEFIAEMK